MKEKIKWKKSRKSSSSPSSRSSSESKNLLSVKVNLKNLGLIGPRAAPITPRANQYWWSFFCQDQKLTFKLNGFIVFLAQKMIWVPIFVKFVLYLELINLLAGRNLQITGD